MTDRYRSYPSSGRAATFSNHARTSLPSSIGYTSLYAGDMHVMPTSTRQQQPVSATPRGYVTTTSTTPTPNTTTRTYAVTQDPRSHRPTTRDVTRTQRSSTLDSTSRPPVIVMTTQKDRANGTSSHSSNARPGSPMRDDYRSSDGQFYTQPASSIRSRSTARSYADQPGTDSYGRSSRERSNSLVRDDPYRNSRQSAIYQNNPRQSSNNVDYGDDGYQYTNAGELVRYDLDHSAPTRTRRRESLDRGYYRPNINYNADQRTFNVDTSPDLSRNHITTNTSSASTSRQYDNRGGPPPSTRGFDKIRGYESPRDYAPMPSKTPEPVSTKQDVPLVATTETTRRPRPVSLYQEGPPRSSHHDDYYRSREDERKMREFREQPELERAHEPERSYETPYFHDDRVTSRGFGIRTDLADEHDDRRERRQEPKKRSDEDLPRETDYERDDRRRSRIDSKEPRRERRESKKGSDDEEKERTRFRDKVATGLGIAATAVGLVPAIKDDDKREKEASRRKGSDDERERERDRDRRRDSMKSERPRNLERDRSRQRDHSRQRDQDRGSRDTSRRPVESRKSGEAVVSASDSDEGKKSTRRRHDSNAFNPNDTSDLRQLKDQLAALNATDKEKEKESPIVAEITSPSSSPSGESRNVTDTRPSREHHSPSDSKPSTPPSEEVRGRELQQASLDDKQVRVVSPPRDKKDEKPLKGILKQPKVSFPEEPNPIREGVAPHKEDKKAREAPAGAKWTKISRKVVNPEALTIGKERFEVRDDFVIVLRVLSKEEIQAYASATQVLRERRRRDEDGGDTDRDREDDDRKRHHRHRRHREDDSSDYEDKDRDRERRRRHRDEEEYDTRSRDSDHHHHHHRSHREREPVLEA
ncbi:uncharacterized protein FIESC28_11007 [Fusarium coffeatum]|uniref:DUF8035 domain-containing protein n=1 Tax=Fusarium coffeatum TaxID=231269 RepID=A0A366QNM0_9HYPO|nr:uncharacterized protein FIESC28_11007 [Fusarium coffeatum]RBR06529.1 hypothetical protein FIESC28_11007 [Fusarium coffeatum]